LSVQQLLELTFKFLTIVREFKKSLQVTVISVIAQVN